MAKSNDPDSESNLSVPHSGPNTEGEKGERSARVSPSRDAPFRDAPSQIDRSGSSLNPDLARKHALQRAVSTITGPIWVGVTILWMRLVARYRIADVRKVREQYRRIRRQSNSPIVICGNHLTLVDSFLMAWALGSGGYWVTHPDELPWNTPESKNFTRTWYSRLFIFMAKCIPITRGGARESVGDVLERVKHLLIRGETALLFPEAGRSRTGRVEEDSGAWGVGRIVGSVPGCRVLCVYLRGRNQETWSDRPAKGDVMEVSLACIEPKSDLRGVRRSRDIAQQVVRQLVRMEGDYFDARQ